MQCILIYEKSLLSKFMFIFCGSVNLLSFNVTVLSYGNMDLSTEVTLLTVMYAKLGTVGKHSMKDIFLDEDTLVKPNNWVCFAAFFLLCKH